MHDSMEVLPNQIWVHSPTQSEATPLTPGFGEGKCTICCRTPNMGVKQGEQATHAQKTQTLKLIQRKAFKGKVKERVTWVPDNLMASSTLVGGEVTG